MQIIKDKSELTAYCGRCIAEHKQIGLVPTMGALHEGHASLVRASVKDNDITVVSVFVNPTQFNNAQDLALYPRTLEADAELLASIGADVVFAPTPEQMYSAEEMSKPFVFDFGGLDSTMEGPMRPGHFNGVVQVVSKLFYLVRPRRAYFGEKDFQQLAIIHYMVERSSLAGTFGELEIVDCPIVRAESGLALSSRNARLSEAQRQTAVAISQTLFASVRWAKEQGATVECVRQRVVDTVNAVEGLEVEYYAIVDGTTLQATDTFEHAVGCITVYCGEVRLIDNVRY